MFKNVVGLVVEYNPFHNGHLHHIQEIDKLFEDNKNCCDEWGFCSKGRTIFIK